MNVSLFVCLALVGPLSAQRESSALEDVLVAAFRHQIAEIFATKAARFAEDPVICVGIADGATPRNPERQLMKRLAVDPSVQPASACVVDGDLAKEKSSGREAVILRAGSVEWLSDDEAHVEMSYYRSKITSSSMTIRVVKEPHGWIGLGPTWKRSTPAMRHSRRS